MAPEQLDPKVGEVGVKTDVYALGAMLYECLTGLPPFQGSSVYAIFEKIVDQPAVSPRRLRAEVPPELDAALPRLRRRAHALPGLRRLRRRNLPRRR